MLIDMQLREVWLNPCVLPTILETQTADRGYCMMALMFGPMDVSVNARKVAAGLQPDAETEKRGGPKIGHMAAMRKGAGLLLKPGGRSVCSVGCERRDDSHYRVRYTPPGPCKSYDSHVIYQTLHEMYAQ